MLDKNIKQNIKTIKNNTKNNPDYKYKEIKLLNHKICLIYNEPLTSSDKIDNFILKNISILTHTKIKNDLINFLYNFIPSSNIKKIDTFDNLYTELQNGFSIILIDGETTCLSIETKEDLTRDIAESQVEKTINGPKDAFVENYVKNVGLIRRRIKSNELVVKEMIIGKYTKTKVGVLYMDDLVEPKLLNLVLDRINKIETDDLLDSSYLRTFLSKNNSAFPMSEMTERPDLTCMYLLEGKIAIVVDTSPFVLLIPVFFVDFFHSPEDYYQKSKNISLTRIIRLISFFISILTPAFYIAITTYNHETIPSELLLNLAAQRSGVPFPAFFEAILMIITFEILRESDIRLPSQMGSAISILGGIILGDAAVAAGIVSPIMVIVIALTAIASLIFSHLDMVNAIRLWRIIFMLFAAIFGLIGIYMCLFLFVTILAGYKSFGKPYLYPMAPINFKLLKDSFIKVKSKQDVKNPLLVKDEVQND